MSAPKKPTTTTEQQIIALLETIEQGATEYEVLRQDVQKLQALLKLWIAANETKAVRMEELETEVRRPRARTYSLGGRIGHLLRRVIA